MRDGTVLLADVYLPDGPERPLPAIVNRTPYERRRSATVAAAMDPERATDAGFAFVCQDVRGRGASEGQFATFLHDGDDTYDTVEWVAAQPWCTGAVGMSGRSYGGATQWLGAVRSPPHLKAMFPVVIGSNYFDSWIYQGGAFQLGFNLFWTRLMGEARASHNLDALYRHLPLPTVPMEEGSVGSRIYQTWLAHPTFDDYWKDLVVDKFNVEDVIARTAMERFYAEEDGWHRERLYRPDVSIIAWRKLCERPRGTAGRGAEELQ